MIISWFSCRKNKLFLPYNKKIPAKSQDFQEPKTKIYETFYLQPTSWPLVL